MELTLKQVAKIFRVSENQIIDWIQNQNLPTELISDQYRFHRADLLEWAALQKSSFSPRIYDAANGDLAPAATRLVDALRAGGVVQNVAGKDLRAILRCALDGLPLPQWMTLDILVELFLAREHLGSTAMGGGIAVPHPRQPVLLTIRGPVIRLCYLSQPLAMPTPDGTPVDTLFLMICPTAHEHLQLLARLGALLQVDAAREALRNKRGGEELFDILRYQEEHIAKGVR
jgi:PTS system nitrogen regulatory IIA component